MCQLILAFLLSLLVRILVVHNSFMFNSNECFSPENLIIFFFKISFLSRILLFRLLLLLHIFTCPFEDLNTLSRRWVTVCRLLCWWISIQLLKVVVRGSRISHFIDKISCNHIVHSAAIWICLITWHMARRNKFHFLVNYFVANSHFINLFAPSPIEKMLLTL